MRENPLRVVWLFLQESRLLIEIEQEMLVLIGPLHQRGRTGRHQKLISLYPPTNLSLSIVYKHI